MTGQRGMPRALRARVRACACTRLSARGHAVCHPALEHDRLQQRARGVDRGRMPCRAGADDTHLRSQLRRHDGDERCWLCSCACATAATKPPRERARRGNNPQKAFSREAGTPAAAPARPPARRHAWPPHVVADAWTSRCTRLPLLRLRRLPLATTATRPLRRARQRCAARSAPRRAAPPARRVSACVATTRIAWPGLASSCALGAVKGDDAADATAAASRARRTQAACPWVFQAAS